jgi:hypothetical protein
VQPRQFESSTKSSCTNLKMKLTENDPSRPAIHRE